jgi:hypothetical protein
VSFPARASAAASSRNSSSVDSAGTGRAPAPAREEPRLAVEDLEPLLHGGMDVPSDAGAGVDPEVDLQDLAAVLAGRTPKAEPPAQHRVLDDALGHATSVPVS